MAASALQSFVSQLWTSQTLVAECSDIEKHKLFGVYGGVIFMFLSEVISSYVVHKPSGPTDPTALHASRQPPLSRKRLSHKLARSALGALGVGAQTLAYVSCLVPRQVLSSSHFGIREVTAFCIIVPFFFFSLQASCKFMSLILSSQSIEGQGCWMLIGCHGYTA